MVTAADTRLVDVDEPRLADASEPAEFDYFLSFPPHRRRGVYGDDPPLLASIDGVYATLHGTRTGERDALARVVRQYVAATDAMPAMVRCLTFANEFSDDTQYVRSFSVSQPGEKASSLGHSGPTPRIPLSVEFWARLMRFIEWAPGWDGEHAEHVDRETVLKAARFAQAVGAAREPHAAPAPDGSVLLQWDRPDGSVVDVYIDEDEPEVAIVTSGLDVQEVPISGPRDLRTLLER